MAKNQEIKIPLYSFPSHDLFNSVGVVADGRVLSESGKQVESFYTYDQIQPPEIDILDDTIGAALVEVSTVPKLFRRRVIGEYPGEYQVYIAYKDKDNLSLHRSVAQLQYRERLSHVVEGLVFMKDPAAITTVTCEYDSNTEELDNPGALQHILITHASVGGKINRPYMHIDMKEKYISFFRGSTAWKEWLKDRVYYPDEPSQGFQTSGDKLVSRKPATFDNYKIVYQNEIGSTRLDFYNFDGSINDRYLWRVRVPSNLSLYLEGNNGQTSWLTDVLLDKDSYEWLGCPFVQEAETDINVGRPLTPR